MKNGKDKKRKALAAGKPNQSTSNSISTNVNSSNAKGQQQSAAQNAPPLGAAQAPEIGLPHEDNPRVPGNTAEVLREQPAINCKNEQGRRARPGVC